MSKRFKNVLLAVGFFLYLSSSNVFADNTNILLNGELLKFDNEPFNEKGRILVPVRNICEDMGCEVSWDENTRQVNIGKDFTRVIFTIDQNYIIINNQKIGIDVAPKIIDDRAYVPIRVFAEAFDSKVGYDQDKVDIQSNMNGDRNEVVFMRKEQEREIDGRKVISNVSIPQILNYNEEVALDRINAYYRKEGCKYIENFRDYNDKGEYLKNLDYEFMAYDLCQNSGNIISFKKFNCFKCDGALLLQKNISGDVFNVKTGEKLRIQDILKGTEQEIEQLVINKLDEISDWSREVYYKVDKDDIEKYVKEGSYYFYINNGKLMLGSFFGDIGISISKNKELFRGRFLEVMFAKNEEEKYRVLEVAHKYFNKDEKIIDKTTFGEDESYVFDGENQIIAIDRSSERIYFIEKIGNYYKVLGEKKVEDKIGRVTALKLVMNKINSKEYSYELGGILEEDDKKYIIVNMHDIEEKVDISVAVDEKTGNIFKYSFE